MTDKPKESKTTTQNIQESRYTKEASIQHMVAKDDHSQPRCFPVTPLLSSLQQLLRPLRGRHQLHLRARHRHPRARGIRVPPIPHREAKLNPALALETRCSSVERSAAPSEIS